MEPATQLAPPGVAVMVVADPGDWFDEVLDGLADQDYANLKNLFLVVGEPGDIPERVRQRAPVGAAWQAARVSAAPSPAATPCPPAGSSSGRSAARPA